MPWYYEPMKDVIACDKLRGGGKQPLIRRCPNGATHVCDAHMPMQRGLYRAEVRMGKPMHVKHACRAAVGQYCAGTA